MNEELKFLWKFIKKNFEGGGGGLRGVRVNDRRIEVFVKIQKKYFFLGGGEGGGAVGLMGGGGGQGGCE